MDKNNKKTSYDGQSIQIFEGIEAVRKRPAMYLGSTYEEGFLHLAWETIDNALDEYLAGYGNKITVSLYEDNILVVEDEGRGIPVDMHPRTKLSTIETIFTYLHAGGKFDRQTYMVSGGLHGVGSTVVNAMSETLEVFVYKKELIYSLKFKNGKKTTKDLVVMPNTTNKINGTKVKFKPNIDLFDEFYQFRLSAIEERLQQTAYINDNLEISLNDYRDNKNYHKNFYYENGIYKLLNKIIGSEKNLLNQHSDSISARIETENIRYSFAFRYTNTNKNKVISFCNNIATVEGGTHEKGFRLALIREIKKYMKNENYYDETKEKLETNDILNGVHAVIVVLHPDPKFAGQTKGKLVNTDLVALSSKIVGESLEKFLDENPNERQKIFRKVIQSMRLRIEIDNKVKEFKIKNSLFESSALPGKLADCASKDRNQNELFIVEGDSAGGSAKLGRDRAIQAILPLKGKIINSEKTVINKLFDNQEISDLLTSLGLNLKNPEVACNEHKKTYCKICQDEMLIAKLRYGKIIIMTDADVDGAHISVLLLTFLYRFTKSLLENHHVYLAQPPLFKLKTGKKVTYLYSDSELNKKLEPLIANNTRYEIQRYKGLGEMNPHQLWETTMNPKTRILKLITIDDVEKANETINLLMGKEVQGRKDFLFANALKVTNLDV